MRVVNSGRGGKLGVSGRVRWRVLVSPETNILFALVTRLANMGVPI